MIEHQSFEEFNEDLFYISKIFAEWNKMYPEKLVPAETPISPIIPIEEFKNPTLIQKRIEDIVTNGTGYSEYIDLRINPTCAIKKYYSDGIKIDWNNLEKSNRQYELRCEKSGQMFPGIEQAIIYYSGHN